MGGYFYHKRKSDSNRSRFRGRPLNLIPPLRIAVLAQSLMTASAKHFIDATLLDKSEGVFRVRADPTHRAIIRRSLSRLSGNLQSRLSRPIVNMPSVYDLKPKFQALLRPVMNGIARLGLTPNAVTLAAIFGSIAVGIAVSFAQSQPALLLLMPAWLFIRMALNAIDGMMARELAMSSHLGAVLNELGDAISDLGLYLPLAFVHVPARWPIVAFSIGAILTEFSGVLGRALGASRHYEGPMGKSDRAFVVGALGLVTFFYPTVFEAWFWIFTVGAFLTAVTCLNRVSKALKELRSQSVRG